MKVYTRTGDKGQTSIGGGKRVSKADGRVELVGSLDELNSLLGLVLSFAPSRQTRRTLSLIQSHLFNLGAQVVGVKLSAAETISQADVDRLEKEIDGREKSLPPLKNFILPSGSMIASLLHLARAVCRRTERSLVSALKLLKLKNPHLLAYLNRLSDLLFVLARSENLKGRKKEIIWKAKKSG